MSAEEAPPPPSPALLERIAGMRPVKTRRPLVDLAIVAGGSLAALAGLLAASRLRHDLGEPLVLAAAAACAVAFAVELWWALVPPRGQVLPVRGRSGTRAFIVWALATAALVFAAHDFARESPELFMPSARGCFLLGNAMALVPVLLALVALRKAVDLAGWRVGVLVGGAAGALAGVGLQLHCANGHALHLIVAHGGAMALPALLLALLVRR